MVGFQTHGDDHARELDSAAGEEAAGGHSDSEDEVEDVTPPAKQQQQQPGATKEKKKQPRKPSSRKGKWSVMAKAQLASAGEQCPLSPNASGRVGLVEVVIYCFRLEPQQTI